MFIKIIFLSLKGLCKIIESVLYYYPIIIDHKQMKILITYTPSERVVVVYHKFRRFSAIRYYWSIQITIYM